MDDTLPDVAYLDEVRQALGELDSVPDGSQDGIGIAATSVEPAMDGLWPELEVAWRLALPSEPGLATVPRSGKFRVPFGRDWLDLSFYPTGTEYAQVVKRELDRTLHRALRLTVGPSSAVVQLPADEVAVWWAEFLAELEALGGSPREVRPGRVEVDLRIGDDQLRVLTFFITPEEWAQLRHQGHGEYGLDELLGAYDEDETFFRYEDAGFTRSVREELPPVRGTTVLRKVAAMRASNPDAKFGWFAYAPDEAHAPGQHPES